MLCPLGCLSGFLFKTTIDTEKTRRQPAQNYAAQRPPPRLPWALQVHVATAGHAVPAPRGRQDLEKTFPFVLFHDTASAMLSSARFPSFIQNTRTMSSPRAGYLQHREPRNTRAWDAWAAGLTLRWATVPWNPRGMMGQPRGDTEGTGQRGREEQAGGRAGGGSGGPGTLGVQALPALRVSPDN